MNAFTEMSCYLGVLLAFTGIMNIIDSQLHMYVFKFLFLSSIVKGWMCTDRKTWTNIVKSHIKSC